MTNNDYTSTIYSDKLKQDIKGFMSADNIRILRENSTIQTIPFGMDYRPDKVAAYFLGSENLAWMITLASGFENGIKDYYYARKIRVPNLDTVIPLLEVE